MPQVMNSRSFHPRSPRPGRVVADTVIYADTLARSYGFRADLAAGAYEWSVTGFNGDYRTRTEVRSLTVLPAENPELPAEP